MLLMVVQGWSAPEDLGDEGAARREHIGCQFKRLQHERALRVRLAGPGAAHIGRAVVQYHLNRLAARLLPDGLHAGRREDALPQTSPDKARCCGLRAA
jgi:hypothetical protein